jgi:purine catabolism regulator
MYRYLGISIEKMLTLEMFEGAIALAGVNGMSRRITKVNVMEVPDIIEWVSEGEFLITTAYSIKDNINVLLDLIPKLNNKGVSGLGIKVGRYIGELPYNIIELADELCFPIIAVPPNVSHTDVISGILTEVINDQMKMMLKIESFNNDVMDIMIKGGKLKEIAQKLYENIGNSLGIYENIYNTSEVICDIEDKDKIDKIINDHINLKYTNQIASTITKGYKIYNDILNTEIVERVTIPIVIENVEYGRLFIWQDKKPLTPLDNMLIESYVHVIALDFVKKLSLYSVESNYKLEFFDDLLSNEIKRQNKAVERAKTYNFYKALKYSVIVILLTGLSETYNKASDNSKLSQEILNSLVFMISKVVKLNKEKIVYVEKSDRILILYGSESIKNEKSIKSDAINFCEKIMTEALKGIYADEFTIGIGKSYEGVANLWKSNEQAKLIVEKLSKKDIGRIIHYDDLGIYKILSSDGAQDELMEFCIDTIKPLIEYDKNNNSELVKTLKAYFECDGNMKKISEKMYMHYNTIIYRLQKIRDITAMDLENGDNRLNLQIAIKAMDFLHI